MLRSTQVNWHRKISKAQKIPFEVRRNLWIKSIKMNRKWSLSWTNFCIYSSFPWEENLFFPFLQSFLSFSKKGILIQERIVCFSLTIYSIEQRSRVISAFWSSVVLFELLDVFKFRKHRSFSDDFFVIFPVDKYDSLTLLSPDANFFYLVWLLSIFSFFFIILKELFYFVRFRSCIDGQLFPKVMVITEHSFVMNFKSIWFLQLYFVQNSAMKIPLMGSLV